jgi:uncharacterized protein (DUF305 family)
MTRTTRAFGLDLMWARRLFAGLGVLVTAGGLVACTSQEPEPPTNSAPVIVPGKPGEEASTIPPGEAEPVEEEPPNDADVTFVQDMIVHHAQAVDMAVLAPERAASKDVKGLADRIADVQQPEIDMMNRWLELYDKPTVDPSAPAGHGGHGGTEEHADMPGMATPDQLEALGAARGQVFDTLFLQLMMAHHEGALTMVEKVRTTGVNVRVQEIADDVAVTQADEIHRMRGLLGA